jgi:magnesium transporter
MIDSTALNEVAEQVHNLLEEEHFEVAAQAVNALHPVDGAALLARLRPEEQSIIVQRLNNEEAADLLSELNEEAMAALVPHLDPDHLVQILDTIEPDVAADLLGELEDAQAADLLGRMANAAEVAPLLAYAQDSAGGIMSSARRMGRHMLRRHMTVAEAITFLQHHYQDEHDIYYLYVLDRYRHLVGIVSLRTLILARPQQTLGEIMSEELITVSPEMDQEEVARLLARYHLLALPVVDAERRLLGIVTVDDVVDVLEEEATEDIYRLAQVSEEAGIYTPITRAIRNRLSWLVVNLATAFLASSVVALFEDVIAQAAVLAIFMPIVAGQGGNAGTQTLTIIVRSLALGEIDLRDGWAALRREFIVGSVNGITIGLLVGVIAWLWKGNPVLGLVIGLAMLGNMLVAAIAGTLVPLVLKLLRVDPALASSIFVTTFTDVCGFALFLGLGLYFLAWLR